MTDRLANNSSVLFSLRDEITEPAIFNQRKIKDWACIYGGGSPYFPSFVAIGPRVVYNIKLRC